MFICLGIRAMCYREMGEIIWRYDPISQMAMFDSQGCLKRRWPVRVASLARIAAGTACQVTVVTGYPALKDRCALERFAERFLEQMPLESSAVHTLN